MKKLFGRIIGSIGLLVGGTLLAVSCILSIPSIFAFILSMVIVFGVPLVIFLFSLWLIEVTDN